MKEKMLKYMESVDFDYVKILKEFNISNEIWFSFLNLYEDMGENFLDHLKSGGLGEVDMEFVEFVCGRG